MHISSKGKLRIITYSVYLLVLFLQFYLVIIGIISNNQFYVFLFGLMATYIVIDGMTKTTAISKKHRIVTAGTLTLTIQLLAILLVISPLNSGWSVIVMGAVGLSISGAISYVNWNAKRKLTPNEMSKY